MSTPVGQPKGAGSASSAGPSIPTPPEPAGNQVVSASRCRPLPPAEFVTRKRDLETALSARSNSPERSEALRLELRFLQEEERYDMLPSHSAAKRGEENTRVTSIDFKTRSDALRTLRGIHQLGWSWDAVIDPVTGQPKLLCRSITTGVYGPDQNCECKPKVAGRWD